MEDILMFFLGMFGFLIVCIIAISGPIAFIWLLQLRKQINNLSEQSAKLEGSLRRLQHDIQTNRSDTPNGDIISVEMEGLPVQPAQPVAIRPAVPIVPFAPPSAPPPPTGHDSGIRKRFESGTLPPTQTIAPAAAKKVEKAEPSEAQSWELWIGRNLFGWVAVVLLILAGALFIRVAINMGWITDTLKVAGIAAFGAALLGIGFYSRRTGLQRFSTMMSSAGIILIYLAGYASYAFYNLISLQSASVVMPGIVFGGFLLAWFYRSKLLGTIAILGGLAVPILVSSDVDQHRELFVYLMSLNIGTLLLVNLLRRAPIAWIAFFGTQALFWLWYVDFYSYPHLIPALFFQSAFYLVFLVDTAIAALKPIVKKLIPTWDDAMRAVLAPIIFFGSIFIFAEHGRGFLYANLGYIAFIMAAWYAVLAVLYKKTTDDRRQTTEKTDGYAPVSALPSAVCRLPSLAWQAAPSAAVVIALGFVAIGIPLQFDAMWITLGWLTVFAGLWYFGHRQTNKTFIVMAYVFAGLGIIRLAGEIVSQIGGVQSNDFEMLAVFNTIALPMIASAGMLIIAAVMKTTDDRRQTTDSSAAVCCLPSVVFGHLGYILLGIILSGESARFFYAHPEIWQPYPPEYLTEAFLLAFWFFWAILLLEIGFWFRKNVIVTTALCGLTLAVLAMLLGGFSQRLEYDVAFNNPFSVVLIVASLVLLFLGYQSSFFRTKAQRHEEESLGAFVPSCEKILGGFAAVGLYALLAILTIEWFYYFRPSTAGAVTFRSVTLLWTIYALLWIALGFKVKSLPIRVCGLIILYGSLVKTTLFDSTVSFGFCSWHWGAGYSLENWIPLANPYFLTMLFPVIPAMVLAVWTNRKPLTEPQSLDCEVGASRPGAEKMSLDKTSVRSTAQAQSKDCGSVGSAERIAWKTAGIIALIALLVYLSVECFQYFGGIKSDLGRFSLTAFWTLAASVLALLALFARSMTLRIASMLLLGIATGKVLLLDLLTRPAYGVPFWNPYAFPMVILAVMVIVPGYMWVHRLKEDSIERKLYRFVSFAGVIFLWLTLSAECFQSVQLQRAGDASPLVAQMALSILWSLFAGILIAVGFIWRSATLRWMAILLFASTLLKILIVDMSGVNELYRFGAVFVLACLLAAATWAYQRFKPEK